jgi:hypothetical protein
VVERLGPPSEFLWKIFTASPTNRIYINETHNEIFQHKSFHPLPLRIVIYNAEPTFSMTLKGM